MDVDTNWCLYCGKKTEGSLYCSKYCRNLDKNKKQRFTSDFNSKPKVQKVCSEMIPPSFNTQYSLKFKNRLNSYSPSMSRKRNATMNQYNPYWMISNSIVNNITKSNSKSRKNSTINITSELENKNEKLNNSSSKEIINSKNISESPKSAQTLIYSSFENQLNDNSITNNNMKNLFSLFYNNKENINNTNINTTTGNGNNGFLKRNESILNLTNIYNNEIQKSISSFSSSSSSIYSSQYNSNGNNGNNYNKVIVINSSSNNQHIKNKEINRTVSSRESNFDNTPRSLDVSSLIDTSMTQLSSVTEVSSITISSETMNSFNKVENVRNKSRNLAKGKNERNSNIKLKFKNLYLSKRISHKISSKNIDYFCSNRKQSRKSSDSYFTSSDEFPATLYTFRQINTRYPKQFRKTSMENYKIHLFKDNNGINKDSKNTMKKIHHKKNVSKIDYMYAIECLNTITTDKDTIKSVKKSGELIEGFENKCVNNTNNYAISDNTNERINSFIIDAYNYPKDIYENDVNQFISNNEVNHQYERDFIHGNLKTNYPFDNNNNNNNNYESPNDISENVESNDLEKQKQDLQQLLIQQIQQQSRYYQENKIDYSYSCTTLSSYTSDESYYDSDDDYSVPDITKQYYETVTVSSNHASPVTSLSFRKHRNESFSIQASLSSLANNDLKKLTSLCNNINSTLEQIKVINEEIESNSNSSKINLKEDKESINGMKLKKKSIQLQHGEQIQPLFHNNTLMVASQDIHNSNFKLYDSDATESITSSTISTDSIKDTNYLYYEETFDKPFYNLVKYS